MADRLGRSSDQTRPASIGRNPRGALAVLLLALAPQIVQLLSALAGVILSLPNGNPAQIALDDGAALVSAPAALLLLANGPATADPLASQVVLALIYTYPLVVLALLTLFVRPRGPQDYYGGIVLVAIAGLALWASSDLAGMRGFSFGPGTVPRMFAILLMGLGAAIAATGLLRDGERLTGFAWRGPLFVSLSILSFAVTVRPLGLVISAFTSFMIAALGTPDTRWKETTVVGIGLTACCSLLFPYALGLPLPLLPRFLLQ
ncbi:MAG TPA: tripartite tricarboxylate transporter TctB family protein [Rhodopseudomonas sp.]|uniref:tripartite tricarboxylate transporter TctB family protein n=1 Tax=Rhodopseudomonas sp. TaxID=1078 RepID=UPI002EDA42FC